MGAARKRNIWEIESFMEDISKLAEKYYNAGYDDGVADTRNDFKSAISDGLRHGSSECGKKLNKYKNS